MTGWTERGRPPLGSDGAALRASDAERDGAAAELAEHFRDGRLDQAEFDERMGRALSARTRGELAALLTDLPDAGQPGTRQAGTRQAPRPPVAGRAPGGLWFPLAPALVLAGLLTAMSVAGALHGRPLWVPWWLILVVIFMARRRWPRRGRTGGMR